MKRTLATTPATPLDASCCSKRTPAGYFIIVLAIVALVSLTGCASDKAAMCKNAQFGYTLSVAMLDKPMTEQAAAYWAAYKVGAQLALQTYCMEK
jgi:hypothetical protein